MDFHGTRRKNETHISTTELEARLYSKSSGQAAKMSFMAHTLMENRSGLLLDILVTEATGTAERESALTLLKRWREVHRRATVGADKAYDTKDFVRQCREQDVTPHVAQNTAHRKRARSMAGRPGTRGTWSANGSANGSRKASAG